MDITEIISTEKAADFPGTLNYQHTSIPNENIVNFDGPDDPSNPVNWSSLYKWTTVMLISVMSLVV